MDRIRTRKLVGKRIREARVAKDLSQDELAVAVGLTSQSALSKIELGLRLPSVYRLRRFADRLDTTMDWLAGREK